VDNPRQRKMEVVSICYRRTSCLYLPVLLVDDGSGQGPAPEGGEVALVHGTSQRHETIQCL
jgi:hypothetical protein